MCQVIHTPDGGEIETMGQLRFYWPRGLVVHPHYSIDDINDPMSDGTDDSDTCICPVDVEASARLNGMVAVEDGRGDWVVTGIQ